MNKFNYGHVFQGVLYDKRFKRKSFDDLPLAKPFFCFQQDFFVKTDLITRLTSLPHKITLVEDINTAQWQFSAMLRNHQCSS